MYGLIKRDGGKYEVAFGKHKGEDLKTSICEDWQYWHWVLETFDEDDPDSHPLLEIIQDTMDEITETGQLWRTMNGR